MKEIKETNKEVVEETQEQKFVKLPLDVVNTLLGYLSTKPYQESVGLINAVQENAELLD